MAALEKSLRGKPGCVLGVNAQRDSEEAILAMCRDKGVEYPMFTAGQYDKADSGGGLPFAVVFDHTGRQVCATHSLQVAEEAYKKAVLAAPAVYLGEARFERLKALASQVEKKTALGKAAADLRKRLGSADEAEKAEAGALLAVVEGYAKSRSAEITDLEQEDPEQGLAEWKALAKDLSGDPLGDAASDQAERSASDPALKTLRQGLQAVAAQAKLLDALPPCKACKGQKSAKRASLTCPDCRKANEAALAPVRKALEGIARKHAGSNAERKAQELLGKL